MSPAELAATLITALNGGQNCFALSDSINLQEKTMKSKHIVFVHGLFGWGRSELGGLFPYWGQAMRPFSESFAVHEAGCGPVSSYHDRACEVFAQIKGGTVDYGAKHSEREHHARYSDAFAGDAFVADWSADNPVILVGHSAGAPTCLLLQQLLAEDYWQCGSSADWVEAVISISGVLNGSTLPYMLGCDKQSGKLAGRAGDFIGSMVQYFAVLGQGVADGFYDLDLDQWIGRQKPARLREIAALLESSRFAKGEDNLAFDLSLQGGYKANRKFATHPNSYYFSIVTGKTHPLDDSAQHAPDSAMHPLLKITAKYQGATVDFEAPPVPGWGSGDLHIDRWRENDGAVSAISQRYPFICGDHAVGGEGLFARERITKGRWYFETAEASTGRRFDHFDAVIGYQNRSTAALLPWLEKIPLFNCTRFVKQPQAQLALYRNLQSLLSRLP
jgi:triacylglycerol esterase/lipase EstA (alpha/beta hydrolase family)